MSELSTSFAEPAYVSRLALRSAPFSTLVDNTLYYSGGQLEHRVNLVLHLVRASDKVGLIIAEHGLGKTTLLGQLALRAGDALRVCMIDGNIHQTPESIMTKSLLDLGIEQNDLATGFSQADNFQNRLKQLRKLNIKPVLVIDNAHLLSVDVLAEICKWLSWQESEQFLLQAIIATTHPLNLSESLSSRLQRIDLPALEQQEVAAYLSERMSKSGYIGEPVFKDQEIARFFKRSRGNPALVNQLAHQKLLGIKSGLVDLSGLNIEPFLNFRWLGILGLIIFFSVVLSYQEQLNNLFKTDKPEHDIETLIIPELENELATINLEQDIVVSHQQAIENELVELVEQLPETITKEPNIQDEKVLSETKSLTETIEVKESSSVDLPPVEHAKSSMPDLHRESWVLQQQSTNYTFQLMGSWEPQEVYDFINKYALTGDVAMLESLRNGRSWYALVYGVYDDKEAALAASKKWPAPLNTLPSWLRRFDSVQKQIKAAEQSR